MYQYGSTFPFSFSFSLFSIFPLTVPPSFAISFLRYSFFGYLFFMLILFLMMSVPLLLLLRQCCCCCSFLSPAILSSSSSSSSFRYTAAPFFFFSFVFFLLFFFFGCCYIFLPLLLPLFIAHSLNKFTTVPDSPLFFSTLPLFLFSFL